jgi:hypothetical protein
MLKSSVRVSDGAAKLEPRWTLPVPTPFAEKVKRNAEAERYVALAQ